jgi:aryl-alcohol dehydrogenase-like predicted oxidoreductase
MRMLRFGRTNVQVPAISLGTWGHGGPNTNEGASVGWTGHDDRLAKEALVEAHRRGITHWDTADAYGAGHAEQLIGEVFAEGVPRNEIFLATKFGYIKGPSKHPYDPAFMRAQCEASLRNMRTEVIDLYYFHHCDFGPDDVYFDDALTTMRALRGEGKIRFVGISDWDMSRIMRFIERVDPDVAQPYRNLIDDDYESSGLKRYVDDHDLGVAFFSPLKHGLLLGKYDAPQHFAQGDFRSNVPEFENAEFIARMRRAREEVTSRFPDKQEPVIHALTGALLNGNPNATVLLGQRNAKQVIAAASAGEALSDEDAAWVRRVYTTSS